MTGRFCTIAEACEIIFRRLELESTVRSDVAWREHLWPALQDGLLVAEGRTVRFENCGFEADRCGKPWPDMQEVGKNAMGPISRDWWLEAVPPLFDGMRPLRLIREAGRDKVELVEIIQIARADVNSLWKKAFVETSSEDKLNLYTQHKFAVFDTSTRRTKIEAKLATKTVLGAKFTKKHFEDAWKELPISCKRARGERDRRPSVESSCKPS